MPPTGVPGEVPQVLSWLSHWERRRVKIGASLVVNAMERIMVLWLAHYSHFTLLCEIDFVKNTVWNFHTHIDSFT